MDKFLGLVDLLFRVGHDQAMQVFFLVTGVSRIRTTFALLYGALATNSDLCLGFCLHLLECVATGANKQSNC